MSEVYTKEHLGSILARFGLPDSDFTVESIDNGHINSTLKITYPHKTETQVYTLQAVNTYVFREPIAVMRNIELITDHIRNKLVANGVQDYKRRVLRFKKTETGENYIFESDKLFWRCYRYITDSETYNTVTDTKLLLNAGKAFGDFQKQLSDFPMEQLTETIPNFHNTRKRIDDLFDAVECDVCGRVKEVEPEIEFFRRHRDMSGKLQELADSGEMPVRVTHNDTKYNNVLLDNKTGEAICVIDLDTVMPGLAVHDFGDAIRYAASTTAEDEKNLDLVHVDMKSFEAFTEGFIGASGGFFTDAEIDNMALACQIITLELASRFLLDYINGDKYFKTHYQGQNLDRARNQIRLAEDMERNLELMNAIVHKYSK